MKQQITYQLVNTAGEISAIVLSPVANDAMPKVANRIMQKNNIIEQVGFLNKNGFRMMGGELSVNGMLAAEFIKTGSTKIRLPRSIVKSVINNQITFNGMTYNASITPLIYVRATNTYVWEQSCGSGSIAYALFSGRRRIRQPSGKIVTISITNKFITYQAPVRVIGSKEAL